MNITTFDINSYIEKLKTKIYNKKIILNSSHNKLIKFKKLGENLIKPENFLKNVSILNEETIVGILGITKNNLNYNINNKQCDYKILIVKHLSLFFKFKNGKTYYVNESSKKILYTWDEQKKILEPHYLKYQHQGSINLNKEIFFTNTIKINTNNTVILPANDIIKEIINNQNIVFNLSTNFLLQVDEKLFNQEIIENKTTGKTHIIIKPDSNYNTFEEELINNKNDFNNNIINSINESKEFILNNKNILNELDDTEKIEFMDNIVKLYKNLDFVKNIVFYSNYKS